MEERSEAEELAETQNVDGILTAAFKVTSGSKSLAVQSRIDARQDFKMNKLKIRRSNHYEIASLAGCESFFWKSRLSATKCLDKDICLATSLPTHWTTHLFLC